MRAGPQVAAQRHTQVENLRYRPSCRSPSPRSSCDRSSRAPRTRDRRAHGLEEVDLRVGAWRLAAFDRPTAAAGAISIDGVDIGGLKRGRAARSARHHPAGPRPLQRDGGLQPRPAGSHCGGRAAAACWIGEAARSSSRSSAGSSTSISRGGAASPWAAPAAARARALRRAGCSVLDEATASVDNETDAILRRRSATLRGEHRADPRPPPPHDHGQHAASLFDKGREGAAPPRHAARRPESLFSKLVDNGRGSPGRPRRAPPPARRRRRGRRARRWGRGRGARRGAAAAAAGSRAMPWPRSRCRASFEYRLYGARSRPIRVAAQRRVGRLDEQRAAGSP